MLEEAKARLRGRERAERMYGTRTSDDESSDDGPRARRSLKRAKQQLRDVEAQERRRIAAQTSRLVAGEHAADRA